MSTPDTPAHTHSPLPWKAFKLAGDSYGIGAPEVKGDESSSHSLIADDVKRHDAKFIVLAVNNHDKLCEALKTFVQLSNNLAVALTAEQISEATAALSNHCHDARAALKESEAK